MGSVRPVRPGLKLPVPVSYCLVEIKCPLQGKVNKPKNLIIHSSVSEQVFIEQLLGAK